MAKKNLKSLSEKELYRLKTLRWRARTDLEFLCHDVLGYLHVERRVHGPVLDLLQHFPLPTKKQFWENDRIDEVTGTWKYTPIKPKLQLDGKRRRLILDPRGHLKTTVNAQAHTIQWILNYPDVAMMIIQSNTEKAELILGEIRKHFQYNERFRTLFPEHCPTKRIEDWGTKGQFTTEARPKSVTRREATVMTLGIDKGSAGLHFDVMKFSDIVEPNNVRTQERIANVIANFRMMENLLVAPTFWIDVEGTRYSHADVYGEIEKAYMAELNQGLDPEYDIHLRGCYLKDFGDEEPRYTPENKDLPDKLDEDGNPIPLWAVDNEGGERFTLERLRRMEKADPYIFSCQQRNNPLAGRGGQVIFVINNRLPQWISRKNFRENVRVAYKEIAVDTGETDGIRSDYSAITVGAWDSYGRLYIDDIDHGRYLDTDLTHRILAMAKKHKPVAVKIEETGFVRGLKPTLFREMQLHNLDIFFDFLKRDNQQTKEERIQRTVKPWYDHGWLRFLEDLPEEVKQHLLNEELRNFPLGKYDDILDTISDLFQNKDWFGRNVARHTLQQVIDHESRRFLQIETPWEEDTFGNPAAPIPRQYIATGGL